MDSTLTTQEYIHLINHAEQQGEQEQLLSLVDSALKAYPLAGTLVYYCGSVYASVGDLLTAKDVIAQAIPNMDEPDVAVFELGFLQVRLGNIESAKKVWHQLDHLDPQHPFCLFKAGMLLLIENEFEKSKEMLTKGIKVNKSLPNINTSIEHLIKRIDIALNAA